ncbi:uncharacterized protein HGUI_01830 [Hanseniaspora guilliermondii]|uniref:RFX-type winged-helix domain-containing protein n=1 Tax=Hanseniaspora guilliermondii TaxID=56406 RepID=A0A1L0FJ57_9ASCO|nr:uncharacterized protein HGUI_01830 [Hanseniaspora guilliermondii]
MSEQLESNIKEDTAIIPLNSNSTKFISTVLNLKSKDKYSDSSSQQYSKLIQNKINSSLLPIPKKDNNSVKKENDGLKKLTHASIFEKKNFDSLNLNVMKHKNFQEVNTRVSKQANRYKSHNMNTQQLSILQEALENYTKAIKVEESYYQIRMGFESGILLKDKDIDKEFQYYLSMILKLSNSVNPDLNFFEHIIGNLISIINGELTNDNLKSKSTLVTSILILRNLSQDSTILTYLIKNMINHLIKMINHVLNYFITNSYKYNLLDIRTEVYQYTLDLLENIALFITNNKANDTESEGTINNLFKNILIIYDDFYLSLDCKILIPILTAFARYITKSDSKFEGFISTDFIKKNISILLTFDKSRENLTIAVLDFLQQYFSNDSRFSFVANNSDYEESLNILKTALINVITPEYLNYPALDDYVKEINNKKIITLGNKFLKEPEVEQPVATMPKHIFERLLKLDDPERSKVFLRCLFEPSLNEEFPQIKLWKVYNEMFKEKVLERGGEMITAINYIKSVPTVIYGASAIVKYDENKNKRFVIQHLKPRKFCIDLDLANETMDTIFLSNDSIVDTSTKAKKIDLNNFFTPSSNEEILRISVLLLKKVLSICDKNEAKVVLRGLIKLNPSLISEFKEMI